MCKLVHIIQFCSFRVTAYTQLWSWVQFCLFNIHTSPLSCGMLWWYWQTEYL